MVRRPEPMCWFCSGRVPECDTRLACINCRDELYAIRHVLNEVRRTLPATRKLSNPALVKALWEKVFSTLPKTA